MRPPLTWLAFTVEALAAYRITRLIVADQLTAEARDRIIEAAYVAAGRGEETRAEVCDHPGAWADHVAVDPDPPKLAYLLTCPWCSGAYVAAAVVAARTLLPRVWRPAAEAFALSAVAGLIAENLQHG